MQHKCLHLSTTACSLTGIIQKEAGQSTNGNYPLNNDPSFISVLHIYHIFNYFILKHKTIQILMIFNHYLLYRVIRLIIKVKNNHAVRFITF